MVVHLKYSERNSSAMWATFGSGPNVDIVCSSGSLCGYNTEFELVHLKALLLCKAIIFVTCLLLNIFCPCYEWLSWKVKYVQIVTKKKKRKQSVFKSHQ